MDNAKLTDKCRGVIVGGAVGDALGYEVEFMQLSAILNRYGAPGITRYALTDGTALFSDDTQMTLFTAEGLINSIADSQRTDIESIMPFITAAYLNWYRTQTGNRAQLPGSRLGDIAALWSRRAPGVTCLNSLANLVNGKPVCNNSKGCGGVMRVAPIGIFDAVNRCDDRHTAMLAGEDARITHHHIASTMASALQALIVKNCVLCERTVDRNELMRIVTDGLTTVHGCFEATDGDRLAFDNMINRALQLGRGEVAQNVAIRELGEGWVGDEALAIALFAVMRHIDNFEACVVCAVNHDGDSDSTGAIAGNILGAIHGYEAIPSFYRDNLEIEPTLVAMADELRTSCAPA